MAGKNDGYNPAGPAELPMAHRNPLDPTWRSLGAQMWEYREEKNCTIEQLNTLGAEGWEMCGFKPRREEFIGAWNNRVDVPMYGQVERYVFKRPKGGA